MGVGSVIRKKLKKTIAKKTKAPINNKMEGPRKPKGYIPDTLELKLIDQIKRHPIKFGGDFGWGTGTETLRAIKGSLDVKLNAQKNAASKAKVKKNTKPLTKSEKAKKERIRVARDAGVNTRVINKAERNRPTTKKPSAVSSSRRSPTKTMTLYKVQEEIRELASKANMSVKAWRRKNSNNALVRKLYSIKPSIKADDIKSVRSIKKGPPISRERIPGVKRNKKGEIIDRDGT